VVDDGFGNPDNGEVFRLGIFNGNLYAGTWEYSGTTGAEVWRSTSGDDGTWSQSVANGFGSASNFAMISLYPYAGHLYVGTFNSDGGAEVWRSASGDPGSWSSVVLGGFGDEDNDIVSALQTYRGDLYASTAHELGGGGEIWRCHSCDGSDWERVVADGLGDDSRRGMNALEVAGNRLFWVVGTSDTGLEVWGTSTGDEGDWHQIGLGGFGDSNNRAPYMDNSVVAFDDTLFVGTINQAHGGEIWVLLNDLFLPLVMRNYP
jgi:hypothetical protein